MDDASRAAQGITIRREVSGDAHVDRALADTTAFSSDFQELMARYAWGTSGLRGHTRGQPRLRRSPAGPGGDRLSASGA